MAAPSTRERVLEVAQRRFIEQGYEATSLREIADELGFTKAALYYHFQSKDQLLAALFEPAERLINELMDRLAQAEDLASWGAALIWVIDAMGENMDFFRLVQRNRNMFEHMAGSKFIEDHTEMHSRVEQAVRRVSDDLQDQIRMIAALGAVTGFDDWAPTILEQGPEEEIKDGLKSAVARLLGLRQPRSRSSRS